jgi:hypothetical protein
MIDNIAGFGATLRGGGYGKYTIEISDNLVYGETASKDCPEDGSFCMKPSKYGLLLTGAQESDKVAHPTS